MNDIEKAILSQMDGKKVKMSCPVCNTETEYICHKDGTANCTKCGTTGKVDLTEPIKQLKAMGVFVK